MSLLYRVLCPIVLAAAIASCLTTDMGGAPGGNGEAHESAVSSDASTQLCRGGAYHSRTRTQRFFQRATG